MFNQSSNITLSNPNQTSEAEKMFKVVFYIFLFIFGTIGNLLVMVVIKAKKQRSVNDFFILNLAISDLTFVLFSLPFYTYELFEAFVKFQFYCKFVWPMMSVTLCVSIFTLMLMSMERCRAIVFPFKPRIKKTSIIFGLVAVWISSLLCILPLSIVTEPWAKSCLEKWPSEHHRKAYTIALFVIQYASPVLVIAAAYITIAIKLLRTKVPNRTSLNSRGQVVKAHTRKENFHIIRTVAVIVILFMVCMLPNQIGWLMYDFAGAEQADVFWASAEALIFLHSCVNPVIYGSLTRQFREGYIRYIRYVCCCGKAVKRTMELSEFRESQYATHHRERWTNHSMLKSTNMIARLTSPMKDYNDHSKNITPSSPLTTVHSYHGNAVARNATEKNLVKAEVVVDSLKRPAPHVKGKRVDELESTCKQSNQLLGDCDCDKQNINFNVKPHLKRQEDTCNQSYMNSREVSTFQTAYSWSDRGDQNYPEHKPKTEQRPKIFKESKSEPNLQSCKYWRIDSLKKRSRDDFEAISISDLRLRSFQRKRRKCSKSVNSCGSLGSNIQEVRASRFIEGSRLNYGIVEDEEERCHSGIGGLGMKMTEV